MRRASLAIFLTVFAAASFGALATAAAAPGGDVYGALPKISDVVISPDGKHLAMITPNGEGRGVHITKIGGTTCRFGSTDLKIRDIFWANADRLIVEVSFTKNLDRGSRDTRFMYEFYRAISVDTACGDWQELLADMPGLNYITGFDFLGRAPDGRNLLIAAISAGETVVAPDSRLKGISTTSYDVYLVDSATGKSQKHEKGTVKTIDWFADSAGKLPLRLEKDEHSGRIRAEARLGGSDDWQTVYDSDAVQDPARAITFLAVGNRPDTAFVYTRNGGDKAGVYEFDLKSRSVTRALFQHQRVDASGLIVDKYSQQAVGVAYIDDLPAADYFDQRYAQMQADLGATFPGEYVSVRSVSSDGKKFVAYVEGVQNPAGAYHYVDMTIPDMSLVGARYPSITAADIAPVKSFTYQARDGMTIPAYLTLPPGSAGKNLPLVVLPHGGPAQRDDASFNDWPQFLATRGYAVLQPQFRGSDGFGARHENAGRHKWGLEMQHDVTDGVKHLVANGTADAAKVCIFGWSYGGYAALAGLAFTPDVYKCGVSGAGPSDLLLLVGDAARRSESVYLGGKSWRDYIGDPTKDRDRLIATSPARHAGKITAPLLLVHGKDDIVVPFRQSQVMADAMKAAGKPVEMLIVDGDDHWLSRPSTNQRLLLELEQFLGKHLK